MQSARSALRLGCPVRFPDRWQGRLVSFQVDEDWQVLNIVISRGLLRPSEVRLPFSIASGWDDDALTLDCTSDQAFGRQVPPLAVLATPLSARTPLSVREARLAGALVERASRRASHLLLGRGLLASDLRVVPVTDVGLEGGALALAAQVHVLPVYRRDSELLQAVRDALAVHPYLTADDRRALGVEVVDGAAYLSGNVRTPQAEDYAFEAASSVPAVSEVGDGGLINDRQLEIDIGRALDGAGLFRHGRIYVRAALGQVTLGGFLNNEAHSSDILRVAAAVPGVRSVDNRMEVEAAASPPSATAAAAPPVPPPEPAAGQGAPEG